MRKISLFSNISIFITVLVTALILFGGVVSAVIMSYLEIKPFFITLILISDAVLSLILPVLLLMKTFRKLIITILIGYIVLVSLVCGIYSALV